MNKKKRLLAVILGAAFVLTAGAATAVAVQVRANWIPPRTSSQSDYPILPVYDPDACVATVPFDRMIGVSDLIVDGTVKAIQPDKAYVTDTADGLVAQKVKPTTGNPPQTGTTLVTPITVSVNNAIKGKPGGKEITIMIMRDYEEAAPQLKPGEHMVFILYLNEFYKMYQATSFQEGYYYIASDKRVYPAKVSDQNKSYSGMTLPDFKSKIKSFKDLTPSLHKD
jgi:hypothetical protein